MITISDVLDSVNRLLVEKWPDRTVYRDDDPKDFERPSFLLETVSGGNNDANAGLVRTKAYMTVTIYTPIDEYGEMESSELLDAALEVMELFNKPVAVGDRYLKVKATYGGKNTGETYVDLQTEFLRERSDAEDTTPLMGEVQINQVLED